MRASYVCSVHVCFSKGRVHVRSLRAQEGVQAMEVGVGGVGEYRRAGGWGVDRQSWMERGSGPDPVLIQTARVLTLAHACCCHKQVDQIRRLNPRPASG